ncbi:MAG: carboxy terminal-processing peptidase, partial [Eudoraea sp.]|nr:carboxy terminal-processing peptidase [Eudoraea sp.]
YIDLGERDQRNPLNWDKISPADYEPWEGYIDYEATIENSAKRMSKNPQIALIEENAQWLKQQQEENVVSLNYEIYKREEKKDKEKSAYFKTISDYDSHLTFESLKYEEELFTKDPILREKRDRWHNNLAKDVYVEEAINVLQDLKLNNIKNGKLASVKG